MLLPMASKPPMSNSVEGVISSAKGVSKSNAAGAAPEPSSQFGEAFASALQDRFGGSKPPAPPQNSAGQTVQAPVNPKRDFLPPDSKAAPNVPNAGGVPPAKLTAEGSPAATVKALVAALPAVPASQENERPSAINSDKETKNDHAKKPQQPSSQTSSLDRNVVDGLLGLAIVPAALPAAPSTAANNKSAPEQSGEPLASTPVVPLLPPAPIAKNVTNTAPVPAPTPKDTEAFSLNLKPKALPAPEPVAPPAAMLKKTENNASGIAGQFVSPVKSVAGVTPVAAVKPTDDEQGNTPKQALQLKTPAISSATNTPSPSPSSLGQSSGVERAGTPRGKDEPAPPMGVTSDGGGTKQELAGFSASPVTFPNQAKSAGSASDLRPVTQPMNLQDNSTNGNVGATKEIAIRLQGESGETIDVKLVDQGGQVQLSVRSSDPATASSLRQDLSSLTSSLDKAGWKPEISVASGSSFEPVNQTRQTDRNSQDSSGSKQPEWQQETPSKRQSASDIWDELLTNQTV